jgi:hypothetical protein
MFRPTLAIFKEAVNKGKSGIIVEDGSCGAKIQGPAEKPDDFQVKIK